MSHRRMSVSMTIPQVRDRSKTVTRRHKNTWKHLRPGDRLTLIEKGMGLAKGEKQVVICDVEIVDVRVECILDVTPDEIEAEGFVAAEWHPLIWAKWWANGHQYRVTGDVDESGELVDQLAEIDCRRIEWRYLN